jgi:hypothetical protein
MPVKMETAVRRGDVSSVISLIAQFSHETFTKLPMQYQAFWSVQDLIAFGTNHAVTYVVKMYKKNNEAGAQFITYLYVALENLYKDLITEAYADKRRAAVYSLDTALVVTNTGRVANMLDILIKERRTNTFDAPIVSRIDAEKAFLQVYAKASSHLRKHLIHWCVQPKVTKYKLTGSKFRTALVEFKSEGWDEILTAEHIRTIQEDVICRNRVVIGTTKFRTKIRWNRPSVEKQLLSDSIIAYA